MLTAIKGEVDSDTIIVGDFNTPIPPMYRSSKMKINKETQALKDTLSKMDLVDIYKTFHPKKTENTFFSSTWVTNQTVVNLRNLKLYQVSFPTTCYETRYQLQKKSVKNTHT